MFALVMALSTAVGITAYINDGTKAATKWFWGETLGESVAKGKAAAAPSYQGNGTFGTTSPARNYVINSTASTGPSWSSVAQLAMFLGFAFVGLRFFEKFGKRVF